MNNDILQISHQNLKTEHLLRFQIQKNNKNIVLKNIKRIRYPIFIKF